METETTPQTCIAVVKPHFVFQKNAAQHSADFKMISASDLIDVNKPVECIRVDGASDEGPSHSEVQFYWTERHMQRGNTFTCVSTRYSGGSYLNKVELMNGCISQAHANTFIPSTLTGSNFNEEGLDNEKLTRNLNVAADIYIERIQDAPCMGSKLKAIKGCEDESATNLQTRRAELLIFLKGSRTAKEKLQQRNPALYEYFVQVWDIRERHMIKNLPDQYVFVLHACYTPGCPHEVCKDKADVTEDLRWYQDGPPLRYVPIPVADRSTWGSGDCEKCAQLKLSRCNGHYKDLKASFHDWQGGKGNQELTPPSQIMKTFHNRHKDQDITDAQIADLAYEAMLAESGVRMYMAHLQQIRKRRQAGVRKAAETRRRRRKWVFMCFITDVFRAKSGPIVYLSHTQTVDKLYEFTHIIAHCFH